MPIFQYLNFSFHRHFNVPGEIANNEYAKFWGVKEVHYGIVQVVNVTFRTRQ